ncbi:MAG: hypothetical protein ACK5JD_01175 [Mangrovibacterium sp.]
MGLFDEKPSLPSLQKGGLGWVVAWMGIYYDLELLGSAFFLSSNSNLSKEPSLPSLSKGGLGWVVAWMGIYYELELVDSAFFLSTNSNLSKNPPCPPFKREGWGGLWHGWVFIMI